MGMCGEPFTDLAASLLPVVGERATVLGEAFPDGVPNELVLAFFFVEDVFVYAGDVGLVVLPVLTGDCVT